jgi:hypothetical protein
MMSKKNIINYRVWKKANYLVHIPFAINNWRIPHSLLYVPIDFAEYIFIVCVILHNLVRENNSCNLYHILYLESLLDIPNSVPQSEGRIASYVWDHFACYFVNKEREAHWREKRMFGLSCTCPYFLSFSQLREKPVLVELLNSLPL